MIPPIPSTPGSVGALIAMSTVALGCWGGLAWLRENIWGIGRCARFALGLHLGAF